MEIKEPGALPNGKSIPSFRFIDRLLSNGVMFRFDSVPKPNALRYQPVLITVIVDDFEIYELSTDDQWRKQRICADISEVTITGKRY